MSIRVLIVPNTGNPRAVEAAHDLSHWLTSEGLEPVLVRDDAERTGLADFGVPPTELGSPALTVALGGDGTILKAVHLVAPAERPVLGVNLGRRGFLSGVSSGRMREGILQALAGEALVERRTTVRAKVTVGGREAGEYVALNEVFIGRGASGRAIEAVVQVNGKPLIHSTCDGIAVATPTGSTAYALSAGGPIVAPDVCGMLVVPVAPHTLASRPLLVGPSDVVEVSLPRPDRGDACFSADGDVFPCRSHLERVEVCRGEHDALLVKMDGRDFYDVVRAQFFGA